MWGIPSVKTLCRQARRLGYKRMALTDTDNLYGLWPFINTCRRMGLEPIIGAELTDPVTPLRAVCLVKTPEGYANLCQLISRRHTEAAFSLSARLPEFAKGLVVLTQNPDLLGTWHGQGVDVAAALPRKPLHRNHPLVTAARQCRRPLVATPGSFFLDSKDHFIHQILRAIDNNTALSRLSARDMAPTDALLQSPCHYKQRFATMPDAVLNSEYIAEKLEFQGPEFGIVMPPMTAQSDQSPTALLLERTLAGAHKRYETPLPNRVRKRIHYELGIIEEKRFCEYFLAVQDIVARSSRICGRGSGAASIVAYCLGITNVCPVKHNLYFERFLNPGRKDPPDIDIDFAWDERDDILEFVLEKFKHHAAMVSSHVLFQPRMAVREVAKVFGLPDGEIGRISKRLPWFWKLSDTDPGLLDRIKQRPEFRFMDFPKPWPEIMACAERIIGTPRYLSVHPGGVVITPEPIDTYVPVEKAPKGVPLMQWEKDSVEDAGLVKIDLLGNRSLGVIRDAVESVRQNTGIENVFDIDPEDDPDTQQNVAQGNTMGCFYIESPAMRLLQKKSRVGDFEHVVIHSSIIRPAANEFIREYIQRLHTGVWKPIHPLLENVLNETFGIMVYQEDVSRVAVKLAGFSHEQADGLRKIMSKKDKEYALKDYYERFRQGAKARGVAQRDINAIWDMIISFSGYSFCKPHSASYARVSFQAAFLKTHYPAEFMAGVISNQGGFYSTFAYVSEARRMGLDILPPDVTQSNIAWSGKDRQLRCGLMAIKGLSGRTMATIINERKAAGFLDIHDFLTRVHPQEDEARALIHSGSLDTFNNSDSLNTSGSAHQSAEADPTPRRSLLSWQFACWQRSRRRISDHPGLFDEAGSAPPSGLTPAPALILPPEPGIERLRREYAALGFLCAHHPIVLYKETVWAQHTVKAADIPGYVGRQIRFAGWLLTGKSVKTKHGDPMKFLTFEDETGLVETVFFPRAYARFCHMLDRGRPYILHGKVESEWGAVTLTVERTAVLTQHPAAYTPVSHPNDDKLLQGNGTVRSGDQQVIGHGGLDLLELAAQKNILDHAMPVGAEHNQ